jgi:hypothetical protein
MPAAGSILLGDVAQHLSSVDIACNFCPRIRKASIGRVRPRDADSNAPAPDLRRLPKGHCRPDIRAMRRASAGPGRRVQDQGRSDAMMDDPEPIRRSTNAVKLPDDIEEKLADGRRLRTTTRELAQRLGIRLDEARDLVRRWLFERQQ